jgi:MFS family permease
VAASPAELPIRRNTALLAGVMAVNSAVLQLVAAVSSLTFVLVTGFEALLGLGPAIFLVSSALTALPAGRLMDSLGRIPVIVGGFALGAAGCWLTALGTAVDSAPAVIAGFALVGSSGGVALLVRTAAGDMYPPEKRARGISYVLIGAVFGAILGPAVFSPLFAGKDELSADVLTIPWISAGFISLVALGLALAVRPDPKQIAERIASDAGETTTFAAAPLREIIGRPGVIPALIAGFASMGVMVSVMNLTGYVVVDHRQHAQHLIFPIIGAHVLGMYALVLFVGTLIDRIGRIRALSGGLVIMAVACAGIQWLEGVVATAVLLFLLGLGWNISFVAATAQLADRTSPAERGKLLGFNDLGSAMLGASLALLGGVVLEALGVAALVLGAAAIVVLPVVWIWRQGMGAGGFEPPKAEPTGLQPVPFGHSGTPPGDRP